MQTALLLSVLAPAVAAALLLVAGEAMGGVAGRVVQGALPPVAAFAAYVPIRGLPEFPPGDASVWALWMAWPGAILSMLGAASVVPALARRIGFGALAGLTAYLVAGPLLGRWSASTAALAIAGTAGGVLAVDWALERRGEALSGPAVPLALAGLSAGVATVLGTRGTALLAQTAGGVAAGFGVLFLLAAWRRSTLSVFVVGPATLMLAGLLLGGACYAEVGRSSLWALFIGSLAVGLVPLSKSLRAPLPASFCLGLMAAAVSGAAIGVGFLPGPESAPEGGEGEAGYDGYGDGDENDYDDGYGY